MLFRSDFEFNYVKQLAARYFSEHKAKNYDRARPKFKHNKPVHKEITKSTEQAHYITGGSAYSYNHPQRLALVLLNNILGGPAMNSRLNLAIREKYGYTYNIESNYIAFSDTGVFNLYLATDKKHLARSIQLANKELEKLCSNPFSVNKLHQYCEQLIGQVAIAQENKTGVMLSLARSLLNYGKIESLEEIFTKIRKISPGQLCNVANEIFSHNRLSSLLYINNAED